MAYSTDSFNYVLRPAKPADLKKLLKLIQESMLSYSHDSFIDPSILDSMHESESDLRKRLKTHLMLCCFDEADNPVGTITLKIRDNLDSLKFSDKSSSYLEGVDKVLYVSRFAVLDTLRGSGIGVRLLEEAFVFALFNEVKTVVLHTAIKNTGRVEFYKNRGFELVDSESGRGYERGLFAKKL